MKSGIQKLITSFKKFLKNQGSFPRSENFTPSINFSIISSIKNPLKRNTGQVVIEYFIILTIIAALTIIGLSTFFPKVRSSFSDVQDAAIGRILHAGDN